ncbi:conserved hypothetical protein [Candidatus Magnetomoraceae bacterium gMMP-15]
MSKSKKKSIIILCLIAGVLYGAYVLLFPDSTPESEEDDKKLSVLDNVMTDVKDGLKKTGVDKVTSYIITRAEDGWSKDKDPFVDGKDAEAVSEVAADHSYESSGEFEGTVRPRPTLVYSGYLQVGDKHLAIINGKEYELTEELELKGYFLNTIEQTWVIIEDRRTGEKITVFFGNPN